MIGLIFFGVAGLASTILGGIHYAKQGKQRQEQQRQIVFSRIQDYGQDI